MGDNDIPSKDAEFRDWLANFITYAGANMTALNLTLPQMELRSGRQTIFTDAFTAHVAAAAMARSRREAKDASRDSMEEAVRGIVRQIQANPTITDTQREAWASTKIAPASLFHASGTTGDAGSLRLKGPVPPDENAPPCTQDPIAAPVGH